MAVIVVIQKRDVYRECSCGGGGNDKGRWWKKKVQERTIEDLLQTQIADGVRAKFLDGAAADARRDKLGMLL